MTSTSAPRSLIRPFSCFATLIALILVGQRVAADSGPPAEDWLAIDRYAAQAAADWQVPGLALAVVAGGDIVLLRGYGVRRLGSAAAVTGATRFAIGSTTKAMTAAALAMLVERGELAWDDRVIDHLEGFRLGDPWLTREVTVRDLLTHRAGLANADHLWYGRDLDAGEIRRRLRFVPSDSSLRSRFGYHNVMVAVAGDLIEAVSGRSWEQNLEQAIFGPLGMTGTVATLGSLDASSDVAAPHAEVDGELTVIDNAPVDAVAAAGAVWSSAEDMAGWLRFLLAGGRTASGRSLLGSAALDELFRPQMLIEPKLFYPTAQLTGPHWISYGLGWFQHDYAGHKIDFHTGSIDGMSALVGLVREAGVGIVVLANRDHAELRHALMYRVFDHVLGRQARDWSAELRVLYGSIAGSAEAAVAAIEAQRILGTSPSLPLERYAAVYDDELYAAARVEQAGDGLRLILGPGLAGTLSHWHFDTFRVDFDAAWRGWTLVTFQLDDRGTPSVLEIGGNRRTRVATEATGQPEP